MLNITPPISIVIPTFNEENFIVGCIESLTLGEYPAHLIEIIVVDGGSTDDTVSRAQEAALNGATLKLISNPKKIVPCAMNLGIAAAANEVVIWVGAHAVYDHSYLTKSVEILLSKKCASVGGVLTPVGLTRVGKAIAVATSNRFGVGNARYRTAKKTQQVDTVFGGCWKKANIVKIGGFNEAWVRNQDVELNTRLREKIGPIIVDPRIKCTYYCRESISALMKQYFSYGYWRFHTVLKHPSTFTLRLAAPLLLLIGLTLSLFWAFFDIGLALCIPTLYLILLLVVSVSTAIVHKTVHLAFLLPAIFAVLHLSWATGFVASAAIYFFNCLFASPLERRQK